MLGAVLVWVAIYLVLSWIMRPAKRAPTEEGALVISYPPRAFVLGVIVGGGFAAGASVALSNSQLDEDWWVASNFAVCAALSLVGVAECLRVRHELTGQGIAYRGLWRQYDRVPWSDVVSVKWSPMQWLVVKANGGRVMRFSGYLDGRDLLTQHLRRYRPALAIDSTTERYLRIWGGAPGRVRRDPGSRR